MISWKVPTLIICIYGFFQSFKPSEPFLEPYLVGHNKNLTEKVVNDEIFPIWTYSYLSVLIVVFLITDLLKYKVVIVLQALMLIATWAILIWGQGVLIMQFMQFFYGASSASGIAYYSYLYAIVTPEHYKIVSGYTRSITLLSRCLAGITAQVLFSALMCDLRVLNIISFASVSLSFVISLFLPRVRHTVYFHYEELSDVEQKSLSEIQTSITSDRVSGSHQSSVPDSSFLYSHSTYGSLNEGLEITSCNTDVYSLCDPSTDVLAHPTYVNICQQSESPARNSNKSDESDDNISWKVKFILAVKLMVKDFITSYSRKSLLIWSIWWAIATCGDLQVLNYIQNLWDVIGTNHTGGQTLNGAVDAVAMLSGAATSLGISCVPANWEAYGELLLALVSLANGLFLVIMARTSNVWICYVLYAIFRMMYQMVITIATFQIAKHLTVRRYGLVFGFNMFMALVLQTILTIIVVDQRGLNVGIRTQFIVNGGYFGMMGILFFVAAMVKLRRSGCVPCKETPEE